MGYIWIMENETETTIQGLGFLKQKALEEVE